MNSGKMNDNLPHWDLSNVFPGLNSPEFKGAVSDVEEKVSDLDAYMQSSGIFSAGEVKAAANELAASIGGYLERLNDIEVIFDTLFVYVYSFISTDSYNTSAMRVLSELEIQSLALQRLDVRFRNWVKNSIPDQDTLSPILSHDGAASAHALYLRELVEKSQYLMSEPEESLASELMLSGANAWAKLNGVVNSQIKADFQKNGGSEELPITVIRNFYNNPDETLRKQAYDVEIAALAKVREPLAASLNGVKGAVNTLNKRRGRTDYLQSSLEQARIDRGTLEAMLSAMHDAFPDLRRYWHAKAALLGKERLPWWDLTAPVGRSSQIFTYAEAQEFILEQFSSFSPRLVDFCRRAFANGWIDAEPRDGKAGGAFCMGLLGVEESRILCNYDGSFDGIITLAHELGHAYHNFCHIGRTPIQRYTPMTIAETASIFNQTIITNAVLGEAEDDDRLAILESFLADSGQVVVDIYSRYLFESHVFEKRAESELSADDFCDLMLQCQKETYGDGLDQEFLHPYMWAWKEHYYRPGMSFYNYPYAFGLLFGLGLYAIYQDREEGFVEKYDNLLADSGLETAADLAARFGIDLGQKAFWEAGLDVIRERIEQYESFVNTPKN